MAVIELDLTARPDTSPGSVPPVHRYRRPGLLLVVVLAFAMGGAAPAASTTWRFLGTVPETGGLEAPFQLTGGDVFTISATGTERVATAWHVERPPRELWTARFPARVVGPDEVRFGAVDARRTGDVVLLSDGPATTVVDAHTGAVRWTSRVPVTPLAGDRIGLVQAQVFRAGTLYDQDSGEPGQLYFSPTGEPHVEPPVRTELRGLDLRTGAALWTVTLSGSVNVFPLPGERAAVLVLTWDRLQRLDGDTGQVVRTAALPEIDGIGPVGGSVSGGLVLVRYGEYSSQGHEVAYATDTFARVWERGVPEVLLDVPSCWRVLCSGPRSALDVLDPHTGRPAWRAPADVDLMRHGDYMVELDAATGAPVRLADLATGAVRVLLAGWTAQIVGTVDQPIVLRRPADGGRSVFGMVLADRDRVQVLGETDGPISDCTSDRSHVVCRGIGGLQIWAYRS